MTTVRVTVPRPRLAQLLRTPGGLPVEQALQQAQEKLQALHPACRTELLQLLEQAEAAFADSTAQPEQVLAALYAIAVRGIGMGQLCNAPGVDVALHSLCDLTDELINNRRYDAEAVRVHLRAWRLLLHAELPPEGSPEVLDGLSRVTARFAN